jgi:hypothetical protein
LQLEPWQRYGGGSKRRRCDDGRLWCTRVPKNPRPNSCGGDRAAGRRHRRRATVLLPTTAARVRAKAVRPDDARRPILDGHTVNRTEAAAVATSHTATVMSRAATAAPKAVAAMSPRRAIVRAEDSTVPTESSSALLSWYGCHKLGRLQLVLRKYSFFVFFFFAPSYVLLVPFG